MFSACILALNTSFSSFLPIHRPKPAPTTPARPPPAKSIDPPRTSRPQHALCRYCQKEPPHSSAVKSSASCPNSGNTAAECLLQAQNARRVAHADEHARYSIERLRHKRIVLLPDNQAPAIPRQLLPRDCRIGWSQAKNFALPRSSRRSAESRYAPLEARLPNYHPVIESCRG